MGLRRARSLQHALARTRSRQGRDRVRGQPTSAPMPLTFSAAMRNVYVVPPVSPVTVSVVAAEVNVTGACASRADVRRDHVGADR